jgi:hypothetical protein
LYCHFRGTSVYAAAPEGTTINKCWYSPTSIAGLAAGTYDVVFLHGDVNTPDLENDPEEGIYENFVWDGAAESDLFPDGFSDLQIDSGVVRANTSSGAAIASTSNVATLSTAISVVSAAVSAVGTSVSTVGTAVAAVQTTANTVNGKLNANFVQLVSANSGNRTITDLVTPKTINITFAN